MAQGNVESMVAQVQAESVSSTQAALAPSSDVATSQLEGSRSMRCSLHATGQAEHFDTEVPTSFTEQASFSDDHGIRRKAESVLTFPVREPHGEGTFDTDVQESVPLSQPSVAVAVGQTAEYDCEATLEANQRVSKEAKMMVDQVESITTGQMAAIAAPTPSNPAISIGGKPLERASNIPKLIVADNVIESADQCWKADEWQRRQVSLSKCPLETAMVRVGTLEEGTRAMAGTEQLASETANIGDGDLQEQLPLGLAILEGEEKVEALKTKPSSSVVPKCSPAESCRPVMEAIVQHDESSPMTQADSINVVQGKLAIEKDQVSQQITCDDKRVGMAVQMEGTSRLQEQVPPESITSEPQTIEQTLSDRAELNPRLEGWTEPESAMTSTCAPAAQADAAQAVCPRPVLGALSYEKNAMTLGQSVQVASASQFGRRQLGRDTEQCAKAAGTFGKGN